MSFLKTDRRVILKLQPDHHRHRVPTEEQCGVESVRQRLAWEFGMTAEVHASPIHISSVDPSPQVTKWGGVVRKLGELLRQGRVVAARHLYPFARRNGNRLSRL